ncbi:leucine-rich repeat protein 1 [Ceratina calcarata]|uniref:Leucine-rich repeat protein 1 n=1 Tax=Ceratina calcarata TaxID=156304 RepID=A0AAJ7J4B5_9HYME|nr:leucine-rich repeat protein 1 [Ceratina calcarata]XP_017883673.1 leucine-rich repeat protein 1 [Ceratina calcarata]XP_017883674.1 leucine-rich repeat protein 1 [Ceratina calcarata]XP_017883675.1 leucine-rich repeat protein 1 [Ceratina calcarata]XP_017883676.1 leucine-rich repeat protein 1 [Ceratina calcarata]XP_026671112.1 leucine-rich repeat protein 1 [Ceratina calcarata]XP_026671113.1 leucine-rich repeat protein 1 [Ceratina calcarata]
MKLQCNVEIGNRVSSTNIVRRKSQRSILAIGRQTTKNTELHILWQTFQNKQGTKYKVDNNISQIFIKFINEGKATIRFIEPPHDLIIQADTIQLKSFIHILKLGITKKIDPSVLSVSNLNPKCMNSIGKTKVTVSKPTEYPILEGFPRTTEELHLPGLNRKSFDRQILKLQSLRILNLSNNQISSLPKELGTLQHLQELILSQNRLNKAVKWAWLDETAMKFNLKLLDISNNMLDKLPEQIGKLGALVNLKASQNVLSYLPHSIGKLFNLRYLDISKNNLYCLPGSMRNLRLVSLDISNNAFKNLIFDVKLQSDIVSLTEYAARSFLKTRCPYDASIIPYTLVKYLDNAKYCICGDACFQYYARKFVDFSLNAIASNIKSSGNATIPFDCYFCSIRCTNPVNSRLILDRNVNP